MKTFTFEFTTGREATAKGVDVWDAMKALGYEKDAMLHIIVKWSQL